MDASRFLSDYFTERTWVLILLAGLMLVVIGYYWLTLRAIRASKWWRIGYLPPISLLYLVRGPGGVAAPLVVMLAGAAAVAAPFVVTRYVQPLLPRHPWERTVDGELHVTLTGLSDFPYSSLKSRPEISVLQIANPDVDDATLGYLVDLPRLHELDLNGTNITDAGLATIGRMPALRSLRIAKTAVTDDGFREHLFDVDRIEQIDVRQTGIKSSTVRKWKAAKEGRNAVN